MDQNFNIEKQSGSACSWKEQRSESHYTDAESNVIDSEKCLELSPECEVANPTEFPNCTMGDLSSSNNSSILTSEHPANVLINQPNKDTEYIKRDFDVLSPPSGFEDDMSDPSEI
ncbi:uncharacterized protein LOC142238262 [Haematobia irritans]|uniref:uncharacterized protein LOC142238262 n=1 Tax=Haematobia irritans TaxID=7368 RepID=UPI003F50C317